MDTFLQQKSFILRLILLNLINFAQCEDLMHSSSLESFLVQSADQNQWDQTGKIGVMVGFSVFGILLFYTISYIFYDIYKQNKMYDDFIEKDIKEMRKLDMASGAIG